MDLIHSDSTAKTTVITTDAQPVVHKADNLLPLKRTPRDIHDFQEVAVYLEEVVLNSDLDLF